MRTAVGERLFRLRSRKRWTLEETGKAIERATPTVHAYEHGARNLTLETFARMLTALSATAEDAIDVLIAAGFHPAPAPTTPRREDVVPTPAT